MENSNCKDYITEKLGTAIVSTVVPVVFAVNSKDGKSPSIPNYDNYMPPYSYINAGDYKSAKELADYLLYVSSNETEYNAYLWYKMPENKEKAWEMILERYQRKETKKHWCRAANSVWNYLRSDSKDTLKPDNSCLPGGIMKEYI